MTVFISERANKDLLRLYSYLDERNPAAAENICKEVDTKFKHLSRFPFIGRERSSLAPGLRSVLVRSLLIFYIVESDRITVVRVIDGRMDIDEEFQR
jgi:toxin ParE1/3/4